MSRLLKLNLPYNTTLYCFGRNSSINDLEGFVDEYISETVGLDDLLDVFKIKNIYCSFEGFKENRDKFYLPLETGLEKSNLLIDNMEDFICAMYFCNPKAIDKYDFPPEAIEEINNSDWAERLSGS